LRISQLEKCDPLLWLLLLYNGWEGKFEYVKRLLGLVDDRSKRKGDASALSRNPFYISLSVYVSDSA
jgi:hypothetical protein